MKPKNYTIIGSGIGALTAGAILARQGHTVSVFEKFDQIGGFATLFKRKGFTFDVSLHQIGGVHSGGMHRLLKAAGIYDRLDYIQHEFLSEIRTAHGDHIAIPNGKGDQFRDMIIERFPSEKKAITHWFSVMKQYGRQMHILSQREKSAIYQAVIDLFAPILIPRIIKGISGKVSLKNAFKSENSELLEILQHFSLYYGLPIDQINEFFPMIANYGYYYHGGFYVKGGGHEMAKQLAKVITEHGGEVHTKSEITAVTVENGRAVSITVNGSKAIEVEHLISGIAPQVLFGKLISNNDLAQSELAKADSKIISVTCSVLYVGLDCPIGDLNPDLANAYEFSYESPLNEQDFYAMFQTKRDFESDYSSWPLTLSIHSNVDKRCLPPEGGTCFDIILADNYDRWDLLSPDQYRAQKIVEREKMIDHLERKIPGIRDHIVVAELGTPKTMERYTGNAKGALYGFAQTPDQAMFKRSARSTIKNIEFASAWGMPGGGYEGAMESGYRIAHKSKKLGFVILAGIVAMMIALQVLLVGMILK